MNRSKLRQILFCALFCANIYFLPRWADWNQNSRLNLVLAIVDDGTLHIDKYYQNTGDYAVFDGHYYSDKAPGLSFLAVPVYALVKPVLNTAPAQVLMARLAASSSFADTLNSEGTGIRSEKVYYAIVLYLVTIATAALPSAALGVLIFELLALTTRNNAASLIAALVYGLATNAFPYAGSFFGHQLVAFLLFGAFSIAFFVGHKGLPARWLALSGFMLGYAVITEYPTALIAGGVFLYALAAIPRRQIGQSLALLIAGGLPPGLLLIAYDLAVFGTILPVGYAHSALYTDIHSQGLISLVGPNAPALWGISFSRFRGLFFVAPILLLAIPGFVIWARRRIYILELGACLWAVISFFLFNGSSVMWHGGFSIGPRYLLPMMPFMTLAVGAAIAAWLPFLWGRALISALSLWSFSVIWIQTVGGQSFPDWSPEPVWQYSLPRLLAGDIARNLGMILGLRQWLSLLPILALLALAAALLVWQLRAHPALREASIDTIPTAGRDEATAY